MFQIRATKAPRSHAEEDCFTFPDYASAVEEYHRMIASGEWRELELLIQLDLHTEA